MNARAGWYDDGSGRLRWWDGTQWTENFAPVEQPPAASAADAPSAPSAAPGTYPAPNASPQPPQYPGAAYPAAPGPQKPPVIGFIALGLGILGTILACIPPVVWIFGFLLLFAAFVLGLIGLFIKDTRKWPAITGLILSVVGAIIGATIGTIILFATLATNLPDTALNPTESTTEAPETDSITEPEDSTTETDGETEDTTAARPDPAEITAGFLVVMELNDIDNYNDPTVAACIGQFMYDSDLSNETLTTIAAGQDIFSPADEVQRVSEVTGAAIGECAG